MRIEGKVAVVTGAASGIGRACAVALARRGADVVLADLDESGMAEVQAEIRSLGRRCAAVRTDTTVVEQVTALADRAFSEMGSVHILMNNAGVAVAGLSHETPLDDWRWVIGVNLMGPIHGIHAFLPRMIAANQGGHIVNTASMAGIVAQPLLGPYCVTKHGIVALSKVLRMELRPHRIGVTALCPGLVATNIFKRGRGTNVNMQAPIFERLAISPETIARKVVAAIEHDRLFVVAPFYMKLVWGFDRLFPRLSNWLLGRLYPRIASRSGATS